ncbi:uncharacterized protein LOC123556624 [Mercenaria mercenaria]|uniref:uncharacterized protein LOC123556624 n=1 Tax=Mercenaria mercenaria TaxID=6596 RepID=UPI00234EB0B8|nr:uncharacterized protein LOC123556624 [Mercenaria mercenaria]
MKPVIGMESGKAEIVTVTGMPEKVPEDRTKGCSSKRIAVSVIVGAVTLAIVAAVIIVSVYFGSKIATDSYKMARQTYKTDDGVVVEEETKVTETEVDVRVPNVAEVIYDFKNGLVVQRFASRETNAQTTCYAQYMNETQAPNTDPERYSDGEMDLYKKDSAEGTESVKWRITNKEVPDYMISENVARMCEGTKIFWMEKVQGDKINKRETCGNKYYYYYCVSYTYPCSYFCRLNYYCRDDRRYLYTTYGFYCLNGCNPGPNNPICP